jgi:pimeloyl-ACP methyl ester carboxylesterase
VATYAWGDGARPILLVHGWGARAARFSAVVGALLERGYSPVSYDAWGHGATPGPAGTILDHQVVIRELAERHGPFGGVVAHSLGVPISLYAVRQGLDADRVVGISGMGDFDYVVDSFRVGLGLPASVGVELRHAIERAYFAGDAGIWERFSAGPMPGHDLLVVHDDRDRVVDPRQADRLLARVGAGAALLRTTGLGHARILDDPDVVSAVVAFLSRSTP